MVRRRTVDLWGQRPNIETFMLSPLDRYEIFTEEAIVN